MNEIFVLGSAVCALRPLGWSAIYEYGKKLQINVIWLNFQIQALLSYRKYNASDVGDMNLIFVVSYRKL